MKQSRQLFAHARDFFAQSFLGQEKQSPVFILVGWGRGEVFLAWIAALYQWRQPGDSCPVHFVLIEPEPFDADLYEAALSWAEGWSESHAMLRVFQAEVQHRLNAAPGQHFLHLEAMQAQVHWLTQPVLAGLRSFSTEAQAAWVQPGLLTQAAQAHALSRLMADGGQLMAPNLSDALQPVLGYAGFEAIDARHVKRRTRPHEPSPSNASGLPARKPMRRVAVVGGGIAGSSVALALCDAGLQVTLFEAESACAQGASGNRVGAFHPHITRDDTPLSQLTRLGCEHTILALERLTRLGLLTRGKDWDLPGHLQTLPAPECDRMQETLARLKASPDWVEWKDENEVFTGSPPGLWFPRGGWVSPSRWVQANLAACAAGLEVRTGERLDALPTGFDAVVVAAAQHSLELAYAPGYSANQVKGQVSVFERDRPLPCVLSGQSYAIDANQDWVLLGATYERPVVDLTPSDWADNENLSRFQATYPDWPVGRLLERRCAVRSVWPDRLAAVGPVGDSEAVWLCTGFASRGLTWAALAAWQLLNLLAVEGYAAPRFKLLDKFAPNRYRRD